MMIVNVASECGYTGQYAQLQELYAFNQDKLTVIATPCNDFGGQEPGPANEIEQFCSLNYGVTFPITEKVQILGESPHPLYQWLMSKERNGQADHDVKWNFQKHLINEDGRVHAVIDASKSPFCDEIMTWLDQ